MRISLISLFAAAVIIFAAGQALAQENERPASLQVVALDECDPATFNAALGPDFCHNVALGKSTKLADLFAEAAAGTPDKNWDFEPDAATIKKGGTVTLTNQGGEPHTFTEVKHFGGGFIHDLNNGEATVPECDPGFDNVDVAKTRVLQGSTMTVSNLSKGEHHFQCCIHPWMRMTVTVEVRGNPMAPSRSAPPDAGRHF